MAGDGCWVVTGASSGIGRALASRLARRGVAVVAAGRNVEAMRRLRDDVLARHPRAEIDVEAVDLASRRSIDDCAERWAARGLRVSVLVNNAGVAMSRFACGHDGFERTWATNVRGPYLLSSALVDRRLFADGAQVLNVASRFHARRLDGRCFHGYGRLGGADAYLQSKLCLILLTRAQAARQGPDGIRFNAIHPGIVRSRLGNDGAIANVVGRLAGLFLPSPDRAARTLEAAARRVAREGLRGAILDEGTRVDLDYDGDVDDATGLLMAALALDVVPQARAPVPGA